MIIRQICRRRRPLLGRLVGRPLGGQVRGRGRGRDRAGGVRPVVLWGAEREYGGELRRRVGQQEGVE